MRQLHKGNVLVEFSWSHVHFELGNGLGFTLRPEDSLVKTLKTEDRRQLSEDSKKSLKRLDNNDLLTELLGPY